MLLALLIVLAILALAGGVWISPFLLIVLAVLLVLAVAGRGRLL